MGNGCCGQNMEKAAPGNLMLDSGIGEEMKKAVEEPDLLGEDHLVQAVSVFTSHVTLLTKDECKKTQEGATTNRCRRLKKYGSDIQSGTQCTASESEAINPLTRMPGAKTVKDKVRKSILLDASRFRLERKCSLEDNYEVLETLGKGSFGEVKVVRNKVTMVKRALKVISKENYHTADNYLEEIEILKQLDHPNVVRLYEFYQDERNFYLITEICEGGDLLSTITSLRKLKQADVAHIMNQALAALKYCHLKGIVHRDIKPENILFSEQRLDSTIKIIDFGRSKALQYAGKLTETAGSLYYMAPEVVENKEYDESCDVWSCGVIMYLLLSGKPPFCEKTKDGTISSIKRGILNFTTPLWHTIDKAAKDLLKRMLNKDPKERISAKDALKHEWFAKYEKPAVSKMDKDECLIEALRNLKSFHAETTLQKAVLSYIASQEIDLQTEKKLRKAFDVLDTDKNGKVSCQELAEEYQKIYKDKSKAQKACFQVIKKGDLNKNGCIDYNEFLMVSMGSKQTITEEMIKRAFDFYDVDKNGKITLDELWRVFGSFCTEREVQGVLCEADINGDGTISFTEFKQVMTMFRKSSSKLKSLWSFRYQATIQ